MHQNKLKINLTNKPRITADNEHTVTRLSRWITIRTNYNVSKANSLYDYSTDENGYRPYQDGYDPTNGTYLDYFRFGGRTYAIEQFILLSSMWIGGRPYHFIDTDGTPASVIAVDMDGDLYDPLYIELDEYGERVRVYQVRRL